LVVEVVPLDFELTHNLTSLRTYLLIRCSDDVRR
jgi:hypothetical protein